MKNPINTVSVIGLGYIGLPTAAMFASRRKKVVGVDISTRAVDTINQGRIHIVEPALDIIVHSVVSEGWLKATTVPEAADAFLIAVPTPFTGDHKPDVSYVKAAAESIAPVLANGNMVILESTSPVGTTEEMVGWLAAARPDLRFPGHPSGLVDVNVAYCPERVLPGHVVKELVQNARIIGGLTAECSARAIDVYRIFVEGDLLVTNARTAEMCKLTENAYRDVNIAFANELALICGELDVNVWDLIRLANRHPRVNILQPGAGVGGHCIAVDPWFIVDRAPRYARLIRTAREVNDSKPHWVTERIMEAVGNVRRQRDDCPESDIRVALLGLAFKPNIDDLRESPALQIAESIAERSTCRLLAVEPNISQLPESLRSATLLALDDALPAADVVAVLVAHREFSVLRERLPRGCLTVDAVGALDQAAS